jgi:4-hydroxyphenylpyruvate dioxygenase-like putative hemolysin
MELNVPAIRGIGDSLIYLVDRYPGNGGDLSIYDVDFKPIEGVPQHPAGAGLIEIDHLTHNVYVGRMDVWAQFYEKLFNFREIRYFDIQGKKTGSPRARSRARAGSCASRSTSPRTPRARSRNTSTPITARASSTSRSRPRTSSRRSRCCAPGT